MIKKISTYVMSVLCIFSLCYYSLKFYSNKCLNLSDEPIMIWVIVLGVLLTTLGLGIYNAHSNYKLRQQQIKLEALLLSLLDNQDDCCDKILESIYNSRDIGLDTFNLIKDKDKEN